MSRVKRNCPFCQKAGGTVLYDNIMAAVGPFDLSYEVKACPHCSGVFSDQLAPRLDYDHYYAVMSKYDWAPEPEDSDGAHVHRLIVRMLREKVPLDSHIFDIGCGSGHLLACFKEAGYEKLSGLDPSPQSADSAKRYYGLDNIHTGLIDTVADTPYLDDCDVCCITAVLEHLYAPVEQLFPAVSRLKAGSRLIVSVPDLDAFTVEKREPFGELSLEHINFFSKRSLEVFFHHLGCKLETCARYPGRRESVLLAVAVKGDQVDASHSYDGVVEDAPIMKAYLKASEEALTPRLASLAQRISGKTVVYGAGSHSARLLPKLHSLDVLKHCVALTDRNPNLHGNFFGGLPVIPPSRLQSMMGYDILVSSFNFEKEIAASLKNVQNKVLTMYRDL